MEDKDADAIFLAYQHSKNNYFASPDIRNIFLKNAQESFENGNFSLSAFYQLEALCFRHNTINHFDYMKVKQEKYDFVLSHNTEVEHSNELLNFAKGNYVPEKSSIEKKRFDPGKEVKNMINFIKILPKEWTVINICKGYNVNMSISIKSEILAADIPLFLTIIKHPRSEEFPEIQPIIQVNCKDINKFYEIHRNFKDITHFKVDGKRNKQEYVKDLKIFHNEIADQIRNLSKTIGPWVCLLTGNVQKKDLKTQQHLFAEVDSLCNELNLNNFYRILLSMLVSHVNYLTEDDITVAIKQLNKHGTAILSNKLFNFLINKKGETHYKYPLTPCILIVDELLDHFPWEMINTSQEICRISSYNILKQLYIKFRNKILNGYLHIEVKNGNCIINPEKNLDAMEKRMNAFFSYWLPHWNCICRDVPSREIIEEIFSSEGIYVYCGHGSGMQFLNNYKTEIEKIGKSVAFLFGCESVKLKSAGLHAELKGDHLYFHAGLCPAIVGLNNIGLDYSLDCYATKILSTWIASENKAHWCTINKAQWKTGKLVPGNNQAYKKNIYEPRLAAILSSIRSDSSQKMYDVVSIIYRGLPVWNVNL